MSQTGRDKARAVVEAARRHNQTPKPHQKLHIRPDGDSVSRPAAQRPSIKPFEDNPATPWRGKSPAVSGTHTKGGANGRATGARTSKSDTRGVEVIVPPHVKVQRGPSYTHDARIQCAPGEQPFGAGFSAAGPGRDITTGKGWGK